jgi:hypothetical protein
VILRNAHPGTGGAVWGDAASAPRSHPQETHDMKRLKMGAVTALAIISLAIAGCQDTGTDASDNLDASIPAISDAALPSVDASAAP